MSKRTAILSVVALLGGGVAVAAWSFHCCPRNGFLDYLASGMIVLGALLAILAFPPDGGSDIYV